MADESNRTTLAYLSRNADFEAGLNADQVEFRAILTGASAFEEGIREERWSGQLLPGEQAARPLWAQQQEAVEELSGDIAEEIDRRFLLLGKHYPFERTGTGLRHRPSTTGVYEFCLAVTNASNLTTGEFARLPAAFEILARDALQSYLGAGSRGLRTGWPREAADGLPSRAKQIFGRVHSQTGEWKWQPQHGRPDDPSPTHVKDLGLDVLVWKAMPDSRIGQLFLVAQCACGTTNWTHKWRDLDLTELRTWLRPLTFAPPVRCYCVPFHIGNTATLQDVSSKAGLTLDRARLALIAEANPEAIRQGALRPYRDWPGIIGSCPPRPTRKRRKSRRGRN
jgi:hypothetical protein